MAAWRIWLWSIALSICLAFIALFAALWNNLSTEWDAEAAAAQFALDNSPVNHILSHDTFTGAGVQEVFEGLDPFGRRWYSFVFGSPLQVQSVPADAVLPRDQILKRTLAAHIRPEQVHLGYLTPDMQQNWHSGSNCVWEVRGVAADGSTVFAYFDAKSGQLLSTNSGR